jgi:hypothetical protein
VRVDVERQPDEARFLESLEHLVGEAEAVGVDDRLAAHLGDPAHDLDHVGMQSGIAAGDGDAVEVPQPRERAELVDDLGYRLVTLHVLAVAAVTGEVALLRRLEPRDGVVGEAPREPVKRERIEAELGHRSGATLCSATSIDVT